MIVSGQAIIQAPPPISIPSLLAAYCRSNHNTKFLNFYFTFPFAKRLACRIMLFLPKGCTAFHIFVIDDKAPLLTRSCHCYEYFEYHTVQVLVHVLE